MLTLTCFFQYYLSFAAHMIKVWTGNYCERTVLFNVGWNLQKNRYSLLNWESGQPLKAVYSKFCCLSRMYPRQQYSANMVWRRRECTRCTALHLDRPYLIIHVGCVMSKVKDKPKWEEKLGRALFAKSLE